MRRRLGVALLVFGSCFWLLGAGDLHPWRQGQVFSGGWELASIDRTPERLLLDLRKDGARTAVEVSPARGPGPRSTAHHRVGPGPGQTPPPALLSEILSHLRQLEASPAGGESLFSEGTPRRGSDRTAESERTVLWAFAALFAAACLWSLRAPRRLLLLLPLGAASLALAMLAVRIRWFNSWDPGEAIAAARPGVFFSFDAADGRRGLTSLWGGPPKPHFVPLERRPGERLIYVFGGSSVVLGADDVFPNMLERRLNEECGGGYKVLNFGLSGAASNTVFNRVFASVEALPPDLLVVYSGHNDYINTRIQWDIAKFHLIRNNPILRGVLAPLYYLWAHLPRPGGPAYSPGDFENRALRFSLEPRLLGLLQACHILSIDQTLFDRQDQAILSAYRRNVEAIRAAARRRGVPILFLTLIGNLEAPPHGIGGAAEDSFRRGMAEPDYAKRMGWLLRARDADVFSGDIRAKSDLNAYLRSLRGGGIYVLDLQQKLQERRFAFGYGDFWDYVHFREGTHRMVSDLIFDFLRQRGLVARGARRRP